MNFKVGNCKNLHGIVFCNIHFCDLLIQISENEKIEKIYIMCGSMFDVNRHKIFLKKYRYRILEILVHMLQFIQSSSNYENVTKSMQLIISHNR